MYEAFEKTQSGLESKQLQKVKDQKKYQLYNSKTKARPQHLLLLVYFIECWQSKEERQLWCNFSWKPKKKRLSYRLNINRAKKVAQKFFIDSKQGQSEDFKDSEKPFLIDWSFWVKIYIYPTKKECLITYIHTSIKSKQQKSYRQKDNHDNHRRWKENHPVKI